MQPKIRISLSVINFKERALATWKLKEWKGVDDKAKHVLFFGMYTDHDYNAWYYNDIPYKSIFWCGSDILNTLENGDFQRKIKEASKKGEIVKHYCETKEEADNLMKMGFEAKIIPSFLGDVNNFPLSYKQSDNPHIWMCAHPDREREYGLDRIIRIAKELPNITFDVYGIVDWLEKDEIDNVIYHGQVTDEKLNEEIKNYQAGFRGNLHEGISEIVIKGSLLGQYIFTKMDVGGTIVYKSDEDLKKKLKKLATKKTANTEGREYWLSRINKFPFLDNK
ncbi:MAG: hypothetical protein ACTSUF_11230 [Candidatus Heimdallarchaeaceae archaeon]